MATDSDPYFALPKLYGAPAYARPPRVVPETERPFDPDDLPIVAEMTEEERTFTAAVFGPVDYRLTSVPSLVPGHPAAPGSNGHGGDADARVAGRDGDAGAAGRDREAADAAAAARRFSLRALTGRKGSAGK